MRIKLTIYPREEAADVVAVEAHKWCGRVNEDCA
jgi:hypothetical protein